MIPFEVGPGLHLELVEERHEEELFKLVDRNRGHLRPWMNWVDEKADQHDTGRFIYNSIGQHSAGEGFQTVIRFEGNLVGVLGHQGWNKTNRRAEIGYWLGRRAQGRGIMTACVRAHVEHLLGIGGLNRLEIRCAVGNRRSRAVAERLGFTLEGVAREAEWMHDHFVDHAVYAMLALEWAALPADVRRQKWQPRE